MTSFTITITSPGTMAMKMTMKMAMMIARIAMSTSTTTVVTAICNGDEVEDKAEVVDPGSVVAASAAEGDHDDLEDGVGDDNDQLERPSDADAGPPGEVLMDEHWIANAYIQALRNASLNNEDLPPG
ncbi:hypothetical protein BOTBODRAFT_47882, partial [Botryobasidium botryosum FD-172 SS1]